MLELIKDLKDVINRVGALLYGENTVGYITSASVYRLSGIQWL